jgi:hypothetical protein
MIHGKRIPRSGPWNVMNHIATKEGTIFEANNQKPLIDPSVLAAINLLSSRVFFQSSIIFKGAV